MMRVHEIAHVIKTSFYSSFPQDKTIWTLNEKEIWRYLYSFIKDIKKKNWVNNTNLRRFFSIIQDISWYDIYVFKYMHDKQDFDEFFDNFLFYLFKKFFSLFLCIYYRYYSHNDITFLNNLTDFFELIINIAREFFYAINYDLDPSNQIAPFIPDESDYLKSSETCFSFINFIFKDNILYYKLGSEKYQFTLELNSKQVIKDKAYNYFFFRKVLKQFYNKKSILNVLEGLDKSFMEETKKALKYV